MDGTWDAHAKCDRELCSLQRKPRGLRGLHPGHGERGGVGERRWKEKGPGLRRTAHGRDCVVCTCSAESGTPSQAVYTIVLMPLGLALLLVGGGGAGGCPWWCTAWPGWPG